MVETTKKVWVFGLGHFKGAVGVLVLDQSYNQNEEISSRFYAAFHVSLSKKNPYQGNQYCLKALHKCLYW